MTAQIAMVQTTGTSAAAGPTSGANADTPSTAGFLQVLDLLLSNASIAQNGSAAVAGMFAPTTSFTSTGTAAESAQSTDGADDGSDGTLDPALCAGLASILQAMGFQVRPEQIAELKPLDQEQLGTALEFAQRNLSRGVPVQDVAENMALLLPRSWPLDGLDGSPAAATAQASGQTGTESVVLPAGFAQSLENARARLGNASSREASTAKDDPKPGAEALAKASPAQAADSVAAAASAGSGSDPRNRSGEGKDGRSPDPSLLQTDSLLRPAAAAEPQARHLVPGGTASEFIGRQVLEKFHVQLSEGRKELSLRLWPEELGEVRLSLRMEDGSKVQAHIVVENDSVRQAMLDSMPQLRDALVKHGMDLERMSVSVGQKDAGSTGSGNASADQDAEGRGGGKGRGGREAEVEVATPLVLGRDTGRRDGYNTFELWS